MSDRWIEDGWLYGHLIRNCVTRTRYLPSLLVTC